MGRVIDPLQLMGAQIDSRRGRQAAAAIHGGVSLQGIHYDLPMASAQVKSCVLLAGLYARANLGDRARAHPRPHRAHAARFWLPGAMISGVISLQGGGSLQAPILMSLRIFHRRIFPGGGQHRAGLRLVADHVGINPTRIGVINILRLMGGDITLKTSAKWAVSRWRISGALCAAARDRHPAGPGAPGDR